MLTIVSQGVREFLDKYKDTSYANGTQAKLAIYCGQISTLEEEVYPLVSEIVSGYGMNPAEVVLKRHKGNSSSKAGVKKYAEPEGSGAAFATLDSPTSKIRIVLLVQIGKEGWDCKSLTGVVLPHEGACPKNMVLQTSCRCLRQVTRGEREKALIWMNKWNADKLNKELKQQQNITLQEFGNKPEPVLKHIERFSRMEKQKVPPIDFFQLKVEYETQVVEKQPDTAARLADKALLQKADAHLVYVQDFEGHLLDCAELRQEEGESLTFQWWLRKIAKESMGTLGVSQLRKHEAQLRRIFEEITLADGDDKECRMDDSAYDQYQIRANVRKAFVPKRDFRITEEVVPDTASILSVERPAPIDVEDDSRIYPSQSVVREILEWDNDPGKMELSPEVKAIVKRMRTAGFSDEEIQTMVKGKLPKDEFPERNQTYHYLPYRFDSNMEREYFVDGLRPLLKGKQLEYYFNGDETLTEFKIRCYKKVGKHWQYDGLYYPDFLVLSRDAEGKIDRICIIETKGEVYASKFRERLRFMREEFVPRNNEAFHRERFQFLYLEDTDSVEVRMAKTVSMLKEFFSTAE